MKPTFKLPKKKNHPDLELFLDLDGVVYDFHKAASEIGFEKIDKSNVRQFWIAVSKISRSIGWWNNLALLPDASELIEFCFPYRFTILTATGSVGYALSEKAQAVQRDFGNVPMITVRSGIDKARFAMSNRILVDDRQNVIDSWANAGGIGVLHTSAESSIEQLKTLGFK